MQLADGPQVTSLDMDRLAQARNISGENKPTDAKLSGWKPLNTKPRKQEMWQAILERDPSQRPKNWKTEEMVKFLVEHPIHDPSTIPEQAGTPPGPTGTANVAPGALVVVDSDDKDASGKQRWSRNKFVRLVHVICTDDLKQDFINRDRKLDRQEMDAKGKDSFWEKAAELFNSSTSFDIDKYSNDSTRFKNLTAAPTGYVAEAAKLKYEFGQMRASLTKALTNFRKSGMGDGEKPDEGNDDASGQDAVRSSEFRDFCQGDEVLEYMHFMLDKHDLIDSATCNMPDGTEFNAGSQRRTSGVKPKIRGAKKRKDLDAVANLKKVLSKMPPLKLHKTELQASAERAHNVRQIMKSYTGLTKLLSKHEPDLLAARQKLTRLEMAAGVQDGDDHSDSEENNEIAIATAKVKELKRLVASVSAHRTQLLADMEQLHKTSADESDEDFGSDEDDEVEEEDEDL